MPKTLLPRSSHRVRSLPPTNRPPRPQATRRAPRGNNWLTYLACSCVCVFSVHPALGAPEAREEPVLAHGDRVVFVGNTFAEGLTDGGYLETLLVAHLDEYQLTFRNLGWSGDTATQRLRPYNFGSVYDHLEAQRADVILLSLGMGESFHGEGRLAEFESEVAAFIVELKARAYNGKTPPRLVLVSPIPHESVPGQESAAAGHNRDLVRYSDALRSIAAREGDVFLDLYTPFADLSGEEPEIRWTLNGIHLNAYGYWVAAQSMVEQLGVVLPQWRLEGDVKKGIVSASGTRAATMRYPAAEFAVEITGSLPPTPPPPSGYAVHRRFVDQHPLVRVTGLPAGRYRLDIDGSSVTTRDASDWARGVPLVRGAAHAAIEALREAICEKNRLFFSRWRALNGEYIYGRRTGPYGQRSFPVEMRKIEALVEAGERRIRSLSPRSGPQVLTLSAVSDDGRLEREAEAALLEPEAAREHFTLAPGFAVNLFASEREFPLGNPVSMAFDGQGRLWVVTMPSYPHSLPAEMPDDKLLVLEDIDGDGRADRHTVFADKLYLPLGFEIAGDAAYISQPPNILRVRDTDGDGVGDVRETILRGFGTEDGHHAISAFTWGPGGSLYFHEGTMLHSQVETPQGTVRCDNAGVFRFRPRTFELEVFASYPFANPWGHVFDRWGQNFIADASPGANFHALPLSGHTDFPRKHPTYPDFTARVRPSSGCEIVSSRHFPAAMQGNFIVNNTIGFRGIKQHRFVEDGSGYGSVEEEPLLYSSDRNFRPVDLQFGPDGALYVVDWYNPLIGHVQHPMRDPLRDHGHGRIWRITYPDKPLLAPARIVGESTPRLLDQLHAPEDRTRYRVRAELRTRSAEEVVPHVERWTTQLEAASVIDEHALLEALWVYQGFDRVAPRLLLRLLEARTAAARAAATRVLRHWRSHLPEALEWLRQRVHDAHPRVRLEAVVALSYFPTPDAVQIALGVLEHPMDSHLEYGLAETLATLEPQWKARVGADTSFAAEPSAGRRYLLDRLSREELLALPPERHVLESLLARPDADAAQRKSSLEGLAALLGSDRVTETLRMLRHFDGSDGAHSAHLVHATGHVLLGFPAGELRAARPSLDALAAAGRQDVTRRTAYAGLVRADGHVEDAWRSAENRGHVVDWLDAVAVVPEPELRGRWLPGVRKVLAPLPGAPAAGKQEETLQLAAIRASVEMTGREAEAFGLLARIAGAVESDGLRAAAFGALRRLPAENWPREALAPLGVRLVAFLREAPVKEHATVRFQDALELAAMVATRLPPELAAELRAAVAPFKVRRIVLRTVPHKMVYDRKDLYVEAGQSVEILFSNTDVMPHNLLITAPGALQEVGEAAERMAVDPSAYSRHFVPESSKVLQATKLLQPGQSEALRFRAPDGVGDYPYVCTFPGHWRIMNGVLHVLEKLDDEVVPEDASSTDPIDETRVRPFVRAWSYEDLAPHVGEVSLGGNYYSGRGVYREASCAQCHQIENKGRAFGPNLTDVRARLSREELLRAILEPSHSLTKGFESQVVVTTAGRVVTGLVVAQDEETLEIAGNSIEGSEPLKISRADVASRKASKLSIMPTGLLYTFTHKEIIQLLVFLEAKGSKEHGLYGIDAARSGREARDE